MSTDMHEKDALSLLQRTSFFEIVRIMRTHCFQLFTKVFLGEAKNFYSETLSRFCFVRGFGYRNENWFFNVFFQAVSELVLSNSM